MGSNRGRASASARRCSTRSWPTSTGRSACCAKDCCRPSWFSATRLSCAPAGASQPPGGIYLHTYAADLARSPDGQLVGAGRSHAGALGRGLRAGKSSGLARACCPTCFAPRTSAGSRISSRAYRETLQRLVPRNRENPRIVLLTPGPYNETYFEHAFLARYLGYTLVEGGDLTVRDNRVFLKTLGGLLPVDVIVRRQDDSFCDPLELRGDSMLGVPGLVQAVRSGNVAVANALGSGLAGIRRARRISSRALPAYPGRRTENAHRRHLVVRPGRAAGSMSPSI